MQPNLTVASTCIFFLRVFFIPIMFTAALSSDILAIRCVNNYVCIGVGNCLGVYEIESREIVAKSKIFDNDNIHNIIKGPADQLFIYGGKNLAICTLVVVADQVKIDLASVRRFNDWIIALGWTENINHTLLSILFAHNNLCFYNASNGETRNLRCREKCILYGGSVLAKNTRETIVFSGTVFQEILIWQAKNDTQYGNDAAVLHRLRGHKVSSDKLGTLREFEGLAGVIFSVTYDSALKIMSSTSDDRTIRLWKVENKNRSDSEEIDWENCDIGLTTTMYGHTARVWRSIVRNGKIISVGEDSHMCIWSLDGELLDKFEAHNGAEIWSIDVSEDNEKIFTGGADGAVNVWPFRSAEPSQGSPVYVSDEKKIPKFVSYKDCGGIFIFMEGGNLISYDQNLRKVRTFLNLPRYSGYCVMQVSPDRTKICLGSKDGFIEVYEEITEEGDWKLRRILDRRIAESKIFSFHWLTNETILACAGEGRLKIIDKIPEIGEIGSNYVLPSSRERWTTAAIIHENLLICGDRAGNVFVYDSRHDHSNSSPAQIFPKIHGRLGVQSFTILGKKLLSTGRDGTVRFYEFNDDARRIKALHSNKIPMDWVCRIFQCDQNLYILGFREVEWMIYSMNLKRIVFRFDCGGGHRSWDFTMRDGKINFLYIKNKRIHELVSSLRNVHLPILNGFHTKEIYRIEPVESASRHNIFVSASEDCTLRLSCIVRDAKSTTEKYRINTLGSYDGHISNIKSLAILNSSRNDESTRNLVVSGGGRAQLKIWELRVSTDGEMLTNNDVTCTELLSYMLRGTDKDRKKNWQSNKPASLTDPETRFMDINVQFYGKNDNLVVIFIACSDGYLRIALYDVASNYLHLSDSVNYCDRCTLKVNSFFYKNEMILMTMSTDGVVRFWRMNESIETLVEKSSHKMVKDTEEINRPFSSLKIHQSGINSFDLRQIDRSRWLVLTGGDDNLLSLVVLEMSTKENELFARVTASWNSSTIHSAQITGAKFMDDNRILSTGIDQLVVIYSYTYTDGVLSVLQIDETITLVPDVQGVMYVHRSKEPLAYVYGKGLEVIILKDDISSS